MDMITVCIINNEYMTVLLFIAPINLQFDFKHFINYCILIINNCTVVIVMWNV